MNYRNRTHTLMSQVEESMDVFDARGDKIGKVRIVKHGDEDPATEIAETATANTAEQLHDNLVTNMAEALAGEPDLPEEIRERLLRYGYIQIDRGPLQSDVIADTEQINRVVNDVVHLNVHGDTLLRL